MSDASLNKNVQRYISVQIPTITWLLPRHLLSEKCEIKTANLLASLEAQKKSGKKYRKERNRLTYTGALPMCRALLAAARA